MTKVEEILNMWVEVTGYDSNQTKFNLLSSNYQFHRCGERITQLLKFDESGVFAALYAKASFETICKGLTCKLIDLLKDPEGMSKYKEMWDMFNCPEMIKIESDAIQNIVKSTNIRPSIGEIDKEKELNLFRDSIESIAEELTQCKTECFTMKSGTSIRKDLKFMTTLSIFNTTTECLLNIEHSPDGLYLCYITDFNSCGGYFAYIIKSGENILSVNDRIDEAFIGEHTRSRNNRFIENKKWDIFPYNELIEPDGKDYLGYAKSLKCEVKPREINEFNPDNVYPIMLAAVLIIRRYAGKRIDDIVDNETVNQVYIDSLLTQNINSKEVKALVPTSSSSSLLCTTNKQIPLFDFTSIAVLHSELDHKYNYVENRDKRYTGRYNGINQLLIDMYGIGFELDKNAVMKRHWPILTEGDSGSSDTVISEFIGPRDKIELEYYRQCRLQLKDHIISGMQKAYSDIGGYEGIRKWYEAALLNNVDGIIERAVNWYIDNLNGEVDSYHISPYSITTSDELSVSLVDKEDGHWQPRLDHKFVLNKPHIYARCYDKQSNRYSKYVCPITGNVANMWFIFIPNTYRNIEKLIDNQAPKILKGFKYSGTSMYRGNSLISSCDPVGFIANPFESSIPNDYYDKFPGTHNMTFNCAIGLSKRGLNKLVKEITNR